MSQSPSISKISDVKPVAVILIFAALLGNEFVITHFVSPSGVVAESTVWSIRWMQAALVVSGVTVLLRKRSMLVVLIVTLAILNLFVFRDRVKSTSVPGVALDGRFQELQAALARETHVGYISDDASHVSGYIGTKNYNLTQYAVAPIVVESGPTRDVIIGNFEKFDPERIPGDLVIDRDFGNGLILLRKRLR
jgi:hypothetical protein